MIGRASRVVIVTGTALLLGACQTEGRGAAPEASTRHTEQETKGMRNPVWENNFPDPHVLETDTGYVAIGTNGNGMNVQTLTSTDLVEWSQGSDALPQLPAWTTPGKVWAPEAARFGDRWAMYYTTRAPNPNIQCIGVAVADKAEGPYVDSRSGPLVCEEDQGGVDRRLAIHGA